MKPKMTQLWISVGLTIWIGAATAFAAGNPVVIMKTTAGDFEIELDSAKAPVTVKNFLSYVDKKFYDGTVFHRVIDNFMIQGGGFTMEKGMLSEKSNDAPIANEAKNGLKNDRGTLAMARTSDPNSATSQFFINHKNNDMLNYPKPDGHGYAVFGKVVKGLDVLDKIAKTKTGSTNNVKGYPMQDVPQTEIKITSVTVKKAAEAAAPAPAAPTKPKKEK
jgi:peptidyl-prolyl cis-trans isomerase A (cyclophilin A)